MTSTTTAEVLPVRVPGEPTQKRTDRHAVVTDPDLGEISVRWRIDTEDRTWIYRCGACGLMTTAECAHTFAMALHLAKTLLGLTPHAADTPAPTSSTTLTQETA